jgi:hypothetical protein
MSNRTSVPSHCNPSTTARRLRARHATADSGQAALVLVVSLTVMLTLFGGAMIGTIVNNAPVLKQASIQRYAYRALASGINAYQNAVNANPYLAACNSSSNANPQCAGLSYQTWSLVPGTDVGNGVIPEYYKFDNPQQIKDATTNAITYLEVQVVGAAGFPGKNVYYSTVAKFTPQNGFLNGVWWSNYESSNFPTGHAIDCAYFYNQGRTINNGTVGNTPCRDVSFVSGDNLLGPVYSNDSLYINGSPTFTGTVNTFDPHCLFVNDNAGQDDIPDCTSLASSITYTQAGSGFNHVYEPLPTDNSKLGATAILGGCYYEGPTTISLSVVGGLGKMTVNSPDTARNVLGWDSEVNQSVGDLNCPVSASQGPQPLPTNGVLYVDAASGTVRTVQVGANPFDVNTGGISQILSNCSSSNSSAVPCYYGASGTPDSEADAFVHGSLSGHLTVASANNVIIDGPLTYKDCTWAGTPSETVCGYNDAVSGPANDTLGLIANKYVEVNRPVYNASAPNNAQGNPLPSCGSNGALAPPLCDPATSTGADNSTNQGLTIDATILALSESFVVNNFDTNGSEGRLNIYGSIQQNARGPVGLSGGHGGGTGYLKYYLWDPRLTLYGPPYYLTPGTPSWALDSSAESYTGFCPEAPPVQRTPATTQPTWPWPTSGPTAGTACVKAS